MFEIDWSKYRLVDVSLRVVPGEGDRRLVLRPYVFPVDGSFGHEVDTVTHLGTHIEAPAHYDLEAEDVTAYPLDLFIGPMVNLRFTEVAPNGEITLGMVQEIVEGIDLREKIVVLSTPHFREDPAVDHRPVLAFEVTEFLVNAGIKLFGFDDSLTIDVSAELAQKTHRVLFDHGVLILEYMGQLGELRQVESYLMALPLCIAGFDSSPVRAVVIEEKVPVGR